MICIKATAKRVEKHLSFGNWCDFYWRFDSTFTSSHNTKSIQFNAQNCRRCSFGQVHGFHRKRPRETKWPCLHQNDCHADCFFSRLIVFQVSSLGRAVYITGFKFQKMGIFFSEMNELVPKLKCRNISKFWITRHLWKFVLNMQAYTIYTIFGTKSREYYFTIYFYLHTGDYWLPLVCWRGYGNLSTRSIDRNTTRRPSVVLRC